MLADNELLRRYSADRSESAFADLVERHGALVYGAALRQLNDADLARDVAQVVFADLARKAASVCRHGSISGWLYTSARFAAANLMRSELRRLNREKEAFAPHRFLTMQEPPPDSDAIQLRPMIEDALQELPDEDREAVLLRYFEERDFKSVGSCLGISHEAARKRVVRAVDSQRARLVQRGI
jgi:RNA polymerase sigma factor (sigma-70 family)